MKAIPWRVQLGFVVTSYAATIALATFLIVVRYLQYVRHPEDVMASSGMYAGGDMLLALFIGLMLLLPTCLLALVLRNSESLYTGYGKAVMGVSLTAPVCLGLLVLPAVNQSPMLLGEFCIFRLINAPFAFAGLVFSRLLARFRQSKRLTTYALLIEGLTFASMVGLLFIGVWTHRRG